MTQQQPMRGEVKCGALTTTTTTSSSSSRHRVCWDEAHWNRWSHLICSTMLRPATRGIRSTSLSYRRIPPK